MTLSSDLMLQALLRTRGVTQERARQQRVLPPMELRPKLPISAERTYERQLVTLVKRTQLAIVDALTPLLPQIAKDEREDVLPPDFEATIEGLRILFAQIAQDASPEDLARAQAENVDRHVKRQLARLIRVSPEFADIGGAGAIEGFVQQNTLLIRDLIFSQLDDVRALLEDSAREGLRSEEIGRRLAEKLGTSVTRATLIARDQTLTLNGQIVQARQQNLGVTEYIWDTSLDERVRDDHRRLHGTRQQWATAPVTDQRQGSRNHPGGDILCRCQAIPVIAL